MVTIVTRRCIKTIRIRIIVIKHINWAIEERRFEIKCIRIFKYDSKNVSILDIWIIEL